MRLPAALFREREFVVEGALDPTASDRAVVFHASSEPPGTDNRWDANSRIVTAPAGAGHTALERGTEDFRRCFPLFLCFPPVIPNDEIVSLKMFHREDEPLRRLFLNDAESADLETLWTEHRFISRQPTAENTYLPLFIGFVSQDQPKEMVTWFEAQRPAFRKRAEGSRRKSRSRHPAATRRPVRFRIPRLPPLLRVKERAELLGLYRSMRRRGVSHEEALRGALARILVAPAFLFRIEAPPRHTTRPGQRLGVGDPAQLFLWSGSAPDAELRRLAAAGKLHTPDVLAAQTRRMLKDDRVRALAVEFWCAVDPCAWL